MRSRERVTRLEVTCNVAGARIMIGDRQVGVTLNDDQLIETAPIEVPLASGAHVVRATREGCDPRQTTAVAGGAVLTFALLKERRGDSGDGFSPPRLDVP